MPSYKITAPDGKSYKVTVPDGGTEQDALNHFKSQFQAQPETKVESDPYKATAQKQSTLQNLAAGAGGGLYGLYLGAKQMLGKATPQEIEDHRKAMEGLRSTTSGTVGEFAGNVAGALPAAFIPGANTYVGSALIGGGLGALQPTMPEESKVDNAMLGAVGGVAGNAIGRGISSLFKPVPRLPDSGRQAGVAAADNIGAPLLPGERTGSTALRQIESVLERTPGSAGMFDRVKDLKQQAFNRAAAKAIGENADDLSENVISRASQRISDKFNEIYSKTNINLNQNFSDKIKDIKTSNAKLGPYANPKVDDLVSKSEQLLKMKTIPPDVYQLIRSELTMSADDAYRAGNSALGKSLKTVRDSLDDAARNSLSKTDQAALDATRKEYAHLKTLVKGNTIESGNVKPHLVNNALSKFNADLYKSGSINSPLSDIGRFSQTFKTSVPNSGTPERTAMYNMLFGNPLTGLPITGLANLYGRAYMSQPVQSYLTKGIVDLSPELQRALALSGALSGASLGSTANQ